MSSRKNLLDVNLSTVKVTIDTSTDKVSERVLLNSSGNFMFLTRNDVRKLYETVFGSPIAAKQTSHDISLIADRLGYFITPDEATVIGGQLAENNIRICDVLIEGYIQEYAEKYRTPV